MPLYRYKALNARGELLDGQMEAASDGEVVLRLQEQGHLPVEARLASEGGGGGSWRTLFKPKPFAGQRLVQFTQQLATLLGGVIVVEVVFAWPGLGRLVFNAVAARDYPLIQGAVLLIAALILVINLLVDVLYAVVDPRIRLG